MKGNRTSVAASLLFTVSTLPILVQGDMAVYCSLNSNPAEFSGYRSFDFYQQCGAACTCSAFELMCLQRQTNAAGYYFTLESHNHEYAEECKEKRECICNTNKELWVANPDVIGDYALPDPLLVPI